MTPAEAAAGVTGARVAGAGDAADAGDGADAGGAVGGAADDELDALREGCTRFLGGHGPVRAAEVLATIPAGPPDLVATESWPPNIAVARRNLARLGVTVVPVDSEESDLPFAAESFDLVVSRHPVSVRWDEVARVLKPGGTYLSQDVGPGSVAELTEFLMGPQPDELGPTRDPKWSVLAAERAGLTVTGVREFRGRMEFGDIAAVVAFLRKVIWIVPGFTTAAYRDRLRDLHDRTAADGPFTATTVRFLIEARK